jgi:putative N6-adenine-specific DNA methylase
VWLGTFLAEAAMIACNIPANINVKNLLSKNDWDNELFDNITISLLKREFHYSIRFDKAIQQSASKAKRQYQEC